MFNIYFKEMKKLFSLIALAGVIAACTPEQVETAFKLAGGKVTVNVEVVDIITGGNYAGAYTVASNFGTVSGNTITYQAEESQIVPAGDYTVSVSGPQLAKTYTSNFTVPGVLAGGQATINVIVPVGEPINGWTIDAKRGEEETWVETYYLENEEGYPTHAYSHAGIDEWYYNNTEFYIEGEVEYWLETKGETIGETVVNEPLGFEGQTAKAAAAFREPFPWDGELETLPIFVSAYAMWNVTQDVYRTQVPVTVVASKAGESDITLGTFDFKYTETTDVEYHEIAYPGAAGHYHNGHGHDSHGTMPNAGGGISYNE